MPHLASELAELGLEELKVLRLLYPLVLNGVMASEESIANILEGERVWLEGVLLDSTSYKLELEVKNNACSIKSFVSGAFAKYEIKYYLDEGITRRVLEDFIESWHLRVVIISMRKQAHVRSINP